MRQLSLVGISEDGTRVVLTAAADPPAGPTAAGAGPPVGGEPAGEFCLALDDRLRAATRGDRARLGQLDVRLESTLRPREIQARIRAGQSPEDVARAAGTGIDRVLRFAAPVLAEREHIVELARRNALHRRAEPAGRSLGEAVTQRLAGHGVDPDTVVWDARRGDGGWVVTASYQGGSRRRTAGFRFDPAARTSAADDDDAHWIAGEARGPARNGTPAPLAPADSFEAMVAAELAAAGAPRGPEGFGRDGAPDAAAPPAKPATSGSSGLGDGPDDGAEQTIDVPFAGRWPEMPGPAQPDPAQPDPARPDPRPSRPRTFARRERTPSRAVTETAPPPTTRPDPAPDPEPTSDPEPTREPEPTPEPEDAGPTEHGPRATGRRRQAVPSWDEIMFGRRGE